MINKQQLIDLYELIKEKNFKYIGVYIDIGLKEPELIINPKNNFEAKIQYYLSTYDDNLFHKHSPQIKILNAIGFDSHEALDHIVKDKIIK
jgi:hypothetical protein